METAIAITSLAISGLTALGSILAYYKCKSCKGFCFECDCFPEAPGQSVVIDNRHESPNIVIARHESPVVFVRQDARHESPIGWRLDNSANLSELTQYFERGRKAKPDYDVSII